MDLSARGFAWSVALLALLGAALVGFYVVRSVGDRMPIAPEHVVAGGDPRLGRQAVARHGCGSCHRIPGVRGADGRVAPPLGGIRERSYLAGRLPNTPEYMVRWIRDPQALVPGTAMPDLGVGPDEARHIAAYLYRLR